MTPFKLITTCPNPHRHGTEVSPLAAVFQTRQNPVPILHFLSRPNTLLLPIFPLGSCSSDPRWLLSFSPHLPPAAVPHAGSNTPAMPKLQETQHRTPWVPAPVYGRLCLLLLRQDDAGKVVRDPPWSQGVFQQSLSSHPPVACTVNSFTSNNCKPMLTPSGVNDGRSKLIFWFCPNLFENLIPPPKGL